MMPVIALFATMAVIYVALCRYHDWSYKRNYKHYGPGDIDRVRVRAMFSRRREFREQGFLLVYGGTIGFVAGFAIHTRILFGAG